jgi:hypothetical protein
MRCAAFFALISFCFPLLLFGQRRGGEGGSISPSGASSSGGSSGYSGSGSSSRSNSSGSYHSSSSGGSGSSSSGSSSRSSSGNYGGSNSAGSGSRSGGGSVGSHSGRGSDSPPRGSGSHAAPHSGIRSGAGGSEVRSANSDARNNLQSFPGNERDAWLAGKLDAELSKIGLALTKEVYQQKMAAWRAAEKQSAAREPDWFARVFLGKSTPTNAAANSPSPKPKPCHGNNCRPAPPCSGPNCPPGLNTPDLVNVCVFDPGQVCRPWGYLEGCDQQGNCYAHLARANRSDCSSILRRLNQEEAQAAVLERDQQTSCSVDSQSPQCSIATADYERAKSTIPQLRNRYQMCRMAAGP